MNFIIRYCPTCNRSSNESRFIGEFCEYCVIDKLKAKIPAKADVSFCKRCGRIKAPEGYAELTHDTLAAAIAQELCHSRCELKVKSFNDYVAIVEFKHPVDDVVVFFEKPIEIKMTHKICQDDYRKSSGYYEAMIQLRGDRDKIERMLAKIEKFISIRSGFITKVEEIENGYDVYVSDKKLAANFFLLNKLKTKVSYTLYSVRNGKKIFRNTYLLRIE